MLKAVPRDSLHYPFETPEMGSLTEVAPDIHWVRSPMPFALDHINLWLVEGADGWALFDTGFPTDESREVWENILNKLLKEKSIRSLNITHFHPDHIGFSEWFCETYDLTMTITETEWSVARLLCTDGSDELTACYRDFYTKAGCDDEFIEFMTNRNGIYKSRVGDIPRTFQRIRDGDTVTTGAKDWQVVVGYGHSPEHACFYNAADKVFISGDLVLPKITPNISVWANEPDSNPLKEYLDSLADFKIRVPDDVLVLPSHGLPFYGLHLRCDQIAEHHEERLESLLEICAEPKTALEVTHAMFRMGLDHYTLMFAVGEALAHLNYQLETGEIARYLREDGVNEYARK